MFFGILFSVKIWFFFEFRTQFPTVGEDIVPAKQWIKDWIFFPENLDFMNKQEDIISLEYE